MSQDPVDSPQRRRLLAGLGTGVVAYGAGVGATAAQTTEEVQARLNNIGVSAWEVTSIEGDDEFAETGVENPELTFRVGTRYTLQNNGWSAHPLEFRDSNGDPLLSQGTDGSFEGDSETNWVDNETSVSFTVTGELADELATYYCTVHSSMNGTIRTVDQSSSDAPADVTISDQSTDGTSVTVDSARLDEGGFVTIHDSSLTNGAVIESVRGTSEYLEVGSVQDLEVELDDPLTSSDTLIAMAHRDSNGNETYDFVTSGGNEDGPYTFDGNPVTDDADVQLETGAAVKLDDQRSDGSSVAVDFARLDDGGFVTIHDSTLLDGDALGSVRGTSQYFDSGVQEEFTVELDEPLSEDDTLIAMPHRDSNGNETYDFVSSDGNADPPYTDNDGAITDSASVQVTAADTRISDQSSDGVTVTVDFTRVDDGGFMTIHDSTLLDGDALGSVRGVSEYLDPGTYENLEVELDDPLTEDDTLIAMPHRDSNGNETYDFVSSGANADPPYTDNDGAITDSASVQVGTAAATQISDQRSDGETVTVDFTRVDDGGFMAIHDSTLLDGDALGSVRGVSEYLDPGTYEDLEVELDEPLSEGDTLIAMPHRDSNGNETYDFVSSEGNVDGPYTDDDGAITNAASVQVTAADTRISDQISDGETVTVDFTRVDDGGFMTIHDSTLLDGDALGSVRGVSEYLDPGTYENLEVELDDPLSEDDTLIAMPHRDSNGNETYDFVSSGGNADAPYTDDSGAITDSASVQVVNASVTFPRQATASPTFTQDEVTSPGVVVNVTSDTETAVVITYGDGDDLVIAGLGVFSADELDGENPVTVAVEDAGGFPGDHTAHAIPTSALSGQYNPGDTVSEETASGVVDNDTATVHQATLTFEDQTTEGAVESGDTVATVDSSLTGDAAYTVDVHVTDDEGGLVAAEWIGSTNVLTGDNEGSEIIAERVPDDGEFNELPFSGTDTFVAMIHLATDASAGDAATPGTGPVVPNVDGASGAVPGGVTATAELTAESDDMDDGDDDSDMDDGDDGDTSGDDGTDGGDDGDTNGGSSDDGGPGFGPIAGAAGLGGLATYAYRKLNLDSEPATPEDDDLDEDAE